MSNKKKRTPATSRGQGKNIQYMVTRQNKAKDLKQRADKFIRLSKKREKKTGSVLPYCKQRRIKKREKLQKK